MGWRPSSWWARSQDRRPSADVPADQAATSQEPGPLPAARAWRELPVLTRVTATPVQRIAVREDFTAGLASHADPRFLQRLTHRVDPSVGGLVDGLAVTGLPHTVDAGPDLTVPRSSPKPAPRIQRQLAWSGSIDLPTVRWELPDDAPGEAPVGVVPPSASESAAHRVVAVEPPLSAQAETPAVLQRELPSSTAEFRPSPPFAAAGASDPTVPAHEHESDDAPLTGEDPPREPAVDQQQHLQLHREHQTVAPTTEPPLHSTRPIAPVVSRKVSPPTVEQSSATQPPVAQPDVAEGPVGQPSLAQRSGRQPPVAQRSVPQPSAAQQPPVAHQPPVAQQPPVARPYLAQPTDAQPPNPVVPALPSIAAVPDLTTGADVSHWTEMPLPLTPASTPSAPVTQVQRSVQVGPAVRQPVTSSPPVPPVVRPERLPPSTDPSPSSEVIIPVAAPTVDVPVLQRLSSPAPDVPSMSTSSSAGSREPMPAASQRPPTFPAPVSGPSVGIPLVQRVSRDRQPPPPAPGAGVSGVAMSFASMFSQPSGLSGESDPVAAPTIERSPAPAADSATLGAELPSPTPPSLPMPGLPVPGPPMPKLTAPSVTAPTRSAPTLTVSATTLTVPTTRGPSLQRQSFDDATAVDQTAETVDTSTSAPTTDASTQTSAAPGPGTSLISASPPVAAPGPPTDLDEMARRLYEPLVARLRAELWLDRERAGVFGDG